MDFGEKAESLHDLRRRVSARDKVICGEKPFAEGVKHMRERYKLSYESAAAFVTWQKTIASGGDPNSMSIPSEKWHLKYDESTGEWVKVPQPGDHPGKQPEGSSQ